jgi:hypothetical protein
MGCDFIDPRIYVNVRFYVHLVCEKRAAHRIWQVPGALGTT